MVHMHHYIIMRLSITLDPDLHQIATARARARHVSLSKEINTLLRAAVVSPDAPDPATQAYRDPLTGFLVSPGRPGLTLEDFQRMEDDDDLRHLENLPKT